MYCIKCGVHLEDSEHICPLCQTKVINHPDIQRKEKEKPYPINRYPIQNMRPAGWLFILTILIFLPQIIVLFCDLQINRSITWSGYVIGALILIYATCVFPQWFKKPNPIIFVSVGFVVAGLYLLYISLATNGGWFLSFAFPVVGCIGIIVTTVVTLVYCLKRGYLYIFGGGFIAAGGFMLLLEYLLHITFGLSIKLWSLFPLSVLTLLGLTLILIAICKPIREVLKRKFFF